MPKIKLRPNARQEAKQAKEMRNVAVMINPKKKKGKQKE
jgi:hypothetical protein